MNSESVNYNYYDARDPGTNPLYGNHDVTEITINGITTVTDVGYLVTTVRIYGNGTNTTTTTTTGPMGVTTESTTTTGPQPLPEDTSESPEGQQSGTPFTQPENTNPSQLVCGTRNGVASGDFYRGDQPSVRADDFIPITDITGHAPPPNTYWDRGTGQFLPFGPDVYFDMTPEIRDMLIRVRDHVADDWRLGRTENRCYAYAESIENYLRTHPIAGSRYVVYGGYVTNWWGPGVQVVRGNPWNSVTDGGVFVYDRTTGFRLYIHTLPLPFIAPSVYCEEYSPFGYMWPSLQPPNMPHSLPGQ